MVNLELRQNKQKLFTQPLENFKTLNGDEDWLVYNNANMSIHVTDKCNADCAFCIAHLRYLNDGLTYLKPEIESDELYYQQLDNILKLVKGVNPSVSITGGEPTVNRKLPAILKILSAHDVRKRTITTNGTGLHYKVNDGSKTVLDCLYDYKLEHLNISRAHYDSAENARLMVMKEHLMPNGLLNEVVEDAKSKGIKIRLSCALLKNGISSYDEIMRYIDWGVKLGADNIIFRQLMQFEEDKVKPGRIPDFCKEEAISLEPVWENFDNDKRFEFYHQVLGYYYYVEVRKYAGANVVSETADLRMINPQLKKYKEQFGRPTAFEMVFHPNGNLCAGWNEHEQVMKEMKYD